jgi:hypothetical protein
MQKMNEAVAHIGKSAGVCCIWDTQLVAPVHCGAHANVYGWDTQVVGVVYVCMYFPFCPYLYMKESLTSAKQANKP